MHWTLELAKNHIRKGPIVISRTYRNLKRGTFYRVESFSTHSETQEPMVTYRDQTGWLHTRPYDLFVEKFEEVME
ncbi:hypothetical protein D3C79_762070 [compost metagenome]